VREVGGQLCPRDCILSQTNAVGSRRRTFFYRENTYFWDKNAVQIRRRSFLFFRERFFQEQKSGPNSIKIPSIWRSRFFPLSKNSSRATERLCLRKVFTPKREVPKPGPTHVVNIGLFLLVMKPKTNKTLWCYPTLPRRLLYDRSCCVAILKELYRFFCIKVLTYIANHVLCFSHDFMLTKKAEFLKLFRSSYTHINKNILLNVVWICVILF